MGNGAPAGFALWFYNFSTFEGRFGISGRKSSLAFMQLQASAFRMALALDELPLNGRYALVLRGFCQHDENTFYHDNRVGRQATRMPTISSENPLLMGNATTLLEDTQPQVKILGTAKGRVK